MKKTIFYKLTIFIIVFPLVLNAEIILDPISVTANRTPTQLSKVGASVRVISQEEIKKSNDVFLIDFLSNTPGIAVAQSGPKGGLSSVFIRGTSPYYTKVIVDGIDISNPSGTQVLPSLSSFVLEDIESIEILKGSHSALYGSQAVGGLINIKTKLMPPELNKKHALSIEYGTYDSKRLNYTYYLRRPDSDYKFNFYSHDTEGFSSYDEINGATEDDGYKQQNFSINGRHFLKNDMTLSINLFSKEEDAEFDDSFTPADNTLYKSSEYSQGINIGIEKYSKNFDQKLNFSNFLSDKTSRSFSTFTSKGKRQKLSYTGSINPKEDYSYIFGIDYTEDKTPLNNKKNDITGLFGQVLMSPNKKLNATIGLRNDRHSSFGYHNSIRLTSAYQLSEKSNLKSSYGTGFRAPSLFELFDSTNGNTELKPEKSQNFDISYIYLFSKNRNSLSGTFFSNEIKDLISWVADFPGAWTGQYNQISRKIKREGFEIENNYKINKKSNLLLSYTHTYSELNGGKVVRVPRNVFLINTDTKINNKLQFSSSLKYANDLSDGSVDPTHSLADYTLVNTKLNYKLSKNVNISFRVENLLNQEYQNIRNYGTSDRAFFIQLNGSY